jgi:protease-4
VGVGIETVGSNKHSDMLSLMRPFDADETAYMQASVEDIYEQFVKLVATSRNKTQEEVDQIAQGRVWAAADALSIGLIDEVGGLQDAISYAAALADMPSSDAYSVVGYPTPPTFLEQLMEQFGGKTEDEISVFLNYQPGKMYARLPYNYDIR